MRRCSIPALLIALLAVTIGLHVGLFALTEAQRSTAADRDRTERDRLTAVQTAERVRQGTDDLTMLVRLYVSTGEPRYRAYYDELLAIRKGRIGLPDGYTPGYWSQVIANGRPHPVQRGATLRTAARLDPSRFSRYELGLLNGALSLSDDLAVVERRVMTRASRIADRGVDARYPLRAAPLYRQLTDRSYLRAKADIIGRIRTFTRNVDERRTARVEALAGRERRLLRAQTIVLVAVVPFDVLMLVLALVGIVRPLRRLVASTQRIAKGAYDERTDESGAREIAILGGEFNRMAAAVERDVRSRVEAERAADEAREVAQEADRAKSDFLARMSHELRTPLVGVSGTLEVLGRSDLDPQQRELVKVADGSAQALLDVIGDVLDFAKIEAGALELTPEPASLTALVSAVMAQYENAASVRGLTISTVTEGDFADAYLLDPARLRQVLSNLLSNAIKFTDEGSVVVRATLAGVEPEGHRVLLTVTDTGIGLSGADEDGLLQPFAQANVSATRNAQGTGLGLAICRDIAVRMGGDLHLRPAPDGGTEAAVSFVVPPVAAPADRAPTVGTRGRRPLPATREAAEDEGSLLLLVEDHAVNRTVLVGQLETIGFRVDAVAGGAEALERLGTAAYGAILTDVHMPGMDGYTFAGAVRTREAGGGRRIPIVALTASAVVEERARCLAAGMDDLVSKPARLQAIADVLARWLPDVAWPDAGGDLIDRTVLDLLSGGDDQLGREVLDDYLATTGDDLAHLRRHLASGDRELLYRQAHRLKGASLLVGAVRVGEHALALEAVARSATQDELTTLVEAIERSVEALAATIV